jgi:hypothetical protein
LQLGACAMSIAWWKRKSFWSFFCIAFGLAFAQIKQYVLLNLRKGQTKSYTYFLLL